MTAITNWFKTLEQWSPRLFLLAGGILLIAAANYAVTHLVDTITFNSWVGLTVLIGRLASLLGVAGLSVQILHRNSRLGKLSRVIVSLAILFTTGLLVTAILSNLGVDNPIAPIFGLGTILLSIITYFLFGIVIIRTGAYSTLIGGLLLTATAGLLWGFFGQMILAERWLGVIGTIAEGVLFATHIAIGYRLLNQENSTDRADPVSNTASE